MANPTPKRTNLTRKRLKDVVTYEPDTGLFRWRISIVTRGGKTQPGGIAGSPMHDGGWRLKIDGIEYVAGRLAIFYMTGRWPIGDAKHKDRNRANNKWENLRNASRSQNQANRMNVPHSAPHKGVSFDKQTQRYRARIRVKGKLIDLGRHDSSEKAHSVYLEAAIKHFGEFATSG